MNISILKQRKLPLIRTVISKGDDKIAYATLKVFGRVGQLQGEFVIVGGEGKWRGISGTGVTIDNVVLSSFPGPISTGIILGLLFGKSIGILLFSWLAVFSGLAKLPKNVRWVHILEVSVLAGIGFTISIFFSELGFRDSTMVSEAKIGIFIAFILAGIIGFTILKMTQADVASDDNR